MMTELHLVQRASTRPARHVNATSIEEVLALLAEHGPAARLIAGGTDLMVEFDRGQRPGVELLIDLTRLEDLDSIHQSRHGVHLGPLVTHNQCIADPLVRTAGLPLAQACWEVGSPALRNRATVVGNVVTASPANDTISALVALDAELSIASSRGIRTVPISAFHTGVRKSVLEADEMVTGITFQPLADQRRGVYVKLGLRRAQAISVVHLAVVATITDGRISDSRLVLGSVAPVVGRIGPAEAILDGAILDAATIEAAARSAAESVSPIDDLRSSAAYRVDQIEVMVARALRALADGVEAAALPPTPALLGGPTVAATSVAGATGSWSDGSTISATVDGAATTAPWINGTLLQWLRDEADLTAAKEGCAEGECGACTIQLDGTAVLSCLVPAARGDGAAITTAAGIADGSQLDPLQQAFIDEAAVQCGFCIPGFIVAGDALRREFPSPNDEQIDQGLAGNLCRCTGYYKIQEAFR